jgi:hypothetical protein
MAVHTTVALLHADAVAAAQQLCEFRYLFSERNEVLLYETSPEFFDRIVLHFQIAFVLHIGRLTDPAKSGKGKTSQENLTFESLLPLAKGLQIENDLLKIRKEIQLASQPIRRVRHKLIAHRDLSQALTGLGLSIPDFLGVVEEILRKIFNAIGLFHDLAGEKFIEIDVWLDPTYHEHVTTLINYLKLGKIWYEIFDRVGASKKGDLPQWFWDAWHDTPTHKAYQ